TVDLPTPEGSEQANSRRQEDLAVLVGSLISGPRVRCVSSSNLWQDRSPGPCPSRFWEPSPWPGNDDHACKATATSNRRSVGACECGPAQPVSHVGAAADSAPGRPGRRCRGRTHHRTHRPAFASHSPRSSLPGASTHRWGVGSDACPDGVGSHPHPHEYASRYAGGGTDADD